MKAKLTKIDVTGIEIDEPKTFEIPIDESLHGINRFSLEIGDYLYTINELGKISEVNNYVRKRKSWINKKSIDVSW